MTVRFVGGTSPSLFSSSCPQLHTSSSIRGEDQRLISVVFCAASMINELSTGWVNWKLKSENDLGFSGSSPRVFIWSNYYLLRYAEVKIQAGSGLMLPLSLAGMAWMELMDVVILSAFWFLHVVWFLYYSPSASPSPSPSSSPFLSVIVVFIVQWSQ